PNFLCQPFHDECGHAEKPEASKHDGHQCERAENTRETLLRAVVAIDRLVQKPILQWIIGYESVPGILQAVQRRPAFTRSKPNEDLAEVAILKCKYRRHDRISQRTRVEVLHDPDDLSALTHPEVEAPAYVE